MNRYGHGMTFVGQIGYVFGGACGGANPDASPDLFNDMYSLDGLSFIFGKNVKRIA